MINLTFNQTHASITNFPATSLPDFTIITGPNGAGKTHLLQALHQGFIKSDVAPMQGPQNQSQIRLFDWSTMVPQDNGFFSSENIRNERQNLYSQFSNLRQNASLLEPARIILRSYGLGQEFFNDPARILTFSKEEIAKLIDPASVSTFEEQLKNALSEFENTILRNLDPNLQVQIKAVSEFTKRPLSSLSDKEILSPAIPTWGQIDLFQQSFARLFVAYRDIKLANNIAQYRAYKGEPNESISDDEFLKRHGPAPWDFVNNSLIEARLDFSINEPSQNDYTSFQPTLRKRSTGIEIPFSALSSGEKVLMSFAFCVYYSNDRRQISVRPKVLLLDEIDAPLHPSMSKNIIDTIKNTLVGTFGIKVIATTHSPSTIALSPEESIYTMKPGEPGLHKSSKAVALNILTVGVPTIAISHDGRRQVFVESPIDAKIYDALYKLLKPKIMSERSLEFVATGTKSAQGGDLNTGCDVVKRLVAELVAAGNSSVFGLLDWDGQHDPTDRISVLAHRSRDGIENVLLDPLLLGIAICRDFGSEKVKLGISATTSYLEICVFGPTKLQELAQAVTKAVFGSTPQNVKVSKYVGGLELQIDDRYYFTDDHQLEAKILEAFPFLHSVSRNQAGRLLTHVIANVLTDNPSFVPMDIKIVIEELLERPAHA